MLNQNRTGVGGITFHRRGHEGSTYVFLMSKSRNLYSFLFSVIILGNSASHLFEMIMLNSYVGMLTQTRIGAGTILFHKRRNMRGHCVFLMCKSRNAYTFYFHSLLLVTQPSHSIEMIMLISMLTQTRIWVGSVTFRRMGPMRGHHVFLISKSRNVCTFSIANYYLM